MCENHRGSLFFFSSSSSTHVYILCGLCLSNKGGKEEKAGVVHVACVPNKTSSWISTGFEKSDILPEALERLPVYSQRIECVTATDTEVKVSPPAMNIYDRIWRLRRLIIILSRPD